MTIFTYLRTQKKLRFFFFFVSITLIQMKTNEDQTIRSETIPWFGFSNAQWPWDFTIQSPLSKGRNVQILQYLDEENLAAAQFIRSLKRGKKIRRGGLESPSGAAVKVAAECRRSPFVYLSLFSCHRHKGTASAAKWLSEIEWNKRRDVFLAPILSLQTIPSLVFSYSLISHC